MRSTGDYPTASEAPRKFSDVLTERRANDPAHRMQTRMREEIGALETQALRITDDREKRKRLQCEAEALRCAIDEQTGRGAR